MRAAPESLIAVADEEQWLSEYFDRYRASLFGVDVRRQLVQLKDWMKEAHAAGGKTILVGNGGSAAIAGHCALDFTKNAGVRCVTFNQADLVSCLANDCGYENWVARALELYADPSDLVILISTSGKSPNMVNGAETASRRRLRTVTFTGFGADNPLRARGDLNFWVNSRAYNIVETTHQVWLLAVCDLVIGAAEYVIA